METKIPWDHLVDALREELQEKGGLIRLLNQQTETIYRRDAQGNSRLEEQIRSQSNLIARCKQRRELVLKQTASDLKLSEHTDSKKVISSFPEYVHPLLEALFAEVERLSGRMDERLRQNLELKERLLSEASSTL
ncbi:MAG: hypothetical protein JOY96_03965 [Verrucomicrobia bacterium]|nr:hypothetical protein [Verrucomicrobiota bacterium]MBV9671797.1 hypothetical protein [Verrucomicrobiota bacterium]